ncbi:F-type H+-transporting ATPase subunit delta [Sporothrix schenckii 1099-18]|uniref:ATP synthase subunit delta, mitochondrial n=1 Tax=Sporothrix schenckii 1099-18 TaxID=1397361 RepID=A0A0F2M9R0_SPOSC|nr:F-type H+-transporting ATPase subunit delta [Sporothrix schenckii 1099-18]KJR86387.1 F-type H+-transporting ATPase subunit delta [Sporothrix schenckii 1099-18]
MNSMRIARAALRARPTMVPRVAFQRRTYADAVPDKASPSAVDASNITTASRGSLNQAELVFASPGTHLNRSMTNTNEMDHVTSPIRTSALLPTIYKSQDVVQVNIPAESGEMGVLANHVPSIEQLKPGLIEVVEESGGNKQFFLSGGFAIVQPNSVLSINAVEGYPIEDFSAEAVKSQLAEAQKIANGSGSEQDIAEAKIEVEVLESIQAALK